MGQLIPNVSTMIVQLCSTFVLFLLIHKYLWKAIQDYLADRSNKMQADLLTSEQAKLEALEDRKKAHEELSKAGSKGEEIVNAAMKEAKFEKENILAQANKEADALRKKAHEQIEAERASMYDSMQKEMVEVAMAAASKLIGAQSDAAMDRKAVDAFVKETTHE